MYTTHVNTYFLYKVHCCVRFFVPIFMLPKDKYFTTLGNFMYCIHILAFYF